MDKTKYIWIDGEFRHWEEAHFHLLTHTLHYGAGAFEGIRFYETDQGPAIFRLKEHTERLFYSARAIGMKIPYSQKQMNDATIELIQKNKVKSGYIRPLAFYGYGKMGLNPAGAPVVTTIAAWPWGSYLGEAAVRVKTSEFIRIHPQSTVADAKITGHYVNSILASIEVKKAGYDEALFLDYRGNVAEGPGENIFYVKNGVLYTPKLGAILAGITRESVIRVARDAGYKIVEKDIRLRDLYDSDECFFTGTAAEITAIASIDDKTIGTGEAGPVTAQLKSNYMGIVHGKNNQYKKWLSVV